MTKTAFLFDLDGTVSKNELLPIIARAVDLEQEFRTLTKLTIDGTIPFEDSFRLRFAMLRSVPVDQVKAAITDIELDQTIAEFIRRRPDCCFIVTGNLHPWIADIVAPLGCRVFANDADAIGGQLTQLKPLMLKSAPVFELRRQFDQIVAIGDGANDVPMFEVADIGIAYGGVHPPFSRLVEIAHYVIYEPEALCRTLNML